MWTLRSNLKTTRSVLTREFARLVACMLRTCHLKIMMSADLFVFSAALGYNPFTDFAGRPEYAHLIPKLKPWVRHDCMRADNGYIQFGIKDLVLSVR